MCVENEFIFFYVFYSMRGMSAAQTLICILVFVVLFYITVIVRANFKSSIDTSSLDNSTQQLISNVDTTTDSGLKLSGLAPVIIGAVFILGIVYGLVRAA